ncbi:hypothetical protein C4D60_Mb04t19150 [Musa balbisiana]|uniref:Nucleotide-diphospho-sugar transferase domain-containing protein n=1 Tax=Musa balbisiana TaxID=52838 RepID=A0A4S8KD64_MUSBA|nr:hypothetical protein C4D60_Mb04t19150 [Musa balbisiana]
MGFRCHGFVVSGCAAGFLVAFLMVTVLVSDSLWLPQVSVLPMFRLTNPKDGLRIELEGASTRNKTLIIGVINKASVEDNGMLQLFLQSMREGGDTAFLIRHVLLVATDQIAYNHCMVLQLHCHQLYTDTVLLSPALSIQSTSLINLASTLTLFLGEVLLRGYSFIFTDMNVMWLRNPFARLNHNGEDMLLSGDLYDIFYFFLAPSSLTDIAKAATVHANCCLSDKAKFADLTAVLDVWKTYNNGTPNVTFPAHNSCAKSWKVSSTFVIQVSKVMFRKRVENSFWLMHHLVAHAQTHQLKTSLQAVAVGNKTLVISYLNKAYVEENGMLDLFLRSLKEGEDTAFLITHLFLITVDQTAFDRCKMHRLHCYRLVSEGLNFSKEQLFMSDGYINLVWQKVVVLGEVLKQGYNFIFTDMDIMWLRNPFSRLSLSGEDLQISCDYYNGRPYDDSNHINTGFFYVASNNKTIKLFDMWFESRKTLKRMHDQDVLEFLKSNGVFKRLGASVRFLDTLYFSGFCEVTKNSKQVITVHANCCRSIKAKVDDLTETLEFWKKLKGTTTVSWPQHRA